MVVEHVPDLVVSGLRLGIAFVACEFLFLCIVWHLYSWDNMFIGYLRTAVGFESLHSNVHRHQIRKLFRLLMSDGHTHVNSVEIAQRPRFPASVLLKKIFERLSVVWNCHLSRDDL